MIKQISIIVIFLLFCMISISYGQVDKLITFQGFLKDIAGDPVNDNVQLTFRIYDESNVQQWQEIHGSVGVQDGLFRVVLGNISPLDLEFDQPYWIGITINSDAELPRTQITGVAYSYYSMETEMARNLDQLGATGGQVLKWSGTEWTPAEDISGGIPPDGSVTTAKLADNAVTSPKIQDGQVQTADLADDAVTQSKLNQMGATGGQVLKWSGSDWAPAEDLSGGTPPDGSVTTAKLADNAVTSPKIQDGQVQTADLADNAVTQSKLNQMGATGGQVLKWSGSDWAPAEDLSGGTPPDGSVTTAKLADNAVTSVKIADGQVGVGDIADNAVTSAKILNGQIVDADISGAAAIAPGKISGTAWTSTNDGAGSGLDADLLDGQQASSFLTPASDFGRSGVAPNLYEGTSTLTSRYVNEGQGNSISSAMIINGTITGADIGTGQVGNSEIASNAVDGSKVQNSSLTAVDLLNEPGIARNKRTSNVDIPLSGTVTATSLSISVPAPGFIIVQGFCYGGISGTSHGTICVGITNSSSETPPAPNFVAFGSTDENAESFYSWGNLTTERTFYASSAGTYSFYLRAWMGIAYGTADVWYPSLVAMYFSTNYGTVVTTSETESVASPDNDGSGGF